VKACHFEELRGDYIIKREIGRGNFRFNFLGSYGVVFKGVKKDEKDVDENNKRR
jgi:hypothetical protein